MTVLTITEEKVEIEKDKKIAFCFMGQGKKWHVFDRVVEGKSFEEGDVCRCTETNIVNGIVTQI